MRKKSRDVMQKLTVFQADGNPVNSWHILSSCVISGQTPSMKYIFLDSSKSGEYADIHIMLWGPVFHMENFTLYVLSTYTLIKCQQSADCKQILVKYKQTAER